MYPAEADKNVAQSNNTNLSDRISANWILGDKK